MGEIIFNRATQALDNIILAARSFRPEHKRVMREQVQRLMDALQ